MLRFSEQQLQQITADATGETAVQGIEGTLDPELPTIEEAQFRGFVPGRDPQSIYEIDPSIPEEFKYLTDPKFTSKENFTQPWVGNVNYVMARKGLNDYQTTGFITMNRDAQLVNSGEMTEFAYRQKAKEYSLDHTTDLENTLEDIRSQFTATDIFAVMGSETAGFVPSMMYNTQRAVEHAVPAGITGAAVGGAATLISGAGASVGATAGGAIMFTAGLRGGALKGSMELAYGESMLRLMQWEGGNGEQIPFRTANNVSIGVGIASGLLELLQIKSIGKVGLSAFKDALRNKKGREYLLNTIKYLVKEYGLSIATEDLQELSQFMGDVLVGWIEQKGVAPDAKQLAKALWDTTISTALGLPGAYGASHVGGHIVGKTTKTTLDAYHAMFTNPGMEARFAEIQAQVQLANAGVKNIGARQLDVNDFMYSLGNTAKAILGDEATNIQLQDQQLAALRGQVPSPVTPQAEATLDEQRDQFEHADALDAMFTKSPEEMRADLEELNRQVSGEPATQVLEGRVTNEVTTPEEAQLEAVVNDTNAAMSEADAIQTEITAIQDKLAMKLDPTERATLMRQLGYARVRQMAVENRLTQLQDQHKAASEAVATAQASPKHRTGDQALNDALDILAKEDDVDALETLIFNTEQEDPNTPPPPHLLNAKPIEVPARAKWLGKAIKQAKTMVTALAEELVTRGQEGRPTEKVAKAHDKLAYKLSLMQTELELIQNDNLSPEEIAQMRSEIDITADKVYRQRETLLDRVVKAFDKGVRQGIKISRKNVLRVQNALKGYVDAALQDEGLQKDKDKFTKMILKANTPEKMIKALPKIKQKIDGLKRNAQTKRAIKRLYATIQRALREEKKGQRPKGFDADTHQILEETRRMLHGYGNMAGPWYAQNKFAELAAKVWEANKDQNSGVAIWADPLAALSDVEKVIFAFAARLRSVKNKSLNPTDNMSLTEIQSLQEELAWIIAVGRTKFAIKKEREAAQLQADIEISLDSINGENPIDLTQETPPSFTERAAQLNEKFQQGNLTFESLLDIASQDDPNRLFVTLLDPFAEDMQSVKSYAVVRELYTRMLGAALGIAADKPLHNHKEQLHYLMKKLGKDFNEKLALEYVGADGEKYKRTITRSQAQSLWLHFQDPSLRESLIEGNKYTFGDDPNGVSTERALEALLTAEDTALAKATQAYYRAFYTFINPWYRETFGHDLPYNEFYSPVQREGTQDGMPEETALTGVLQYLQRSAVPQSAKTRTGSVGPIALQDMAPTVIKHAGQWVHAMTWYDKLRRINAVLKNPDIKKTIERKYGSAVYKGLQERYKAFVEARHARYRAYEGVISWFSAGTVRAILGAKGVMQVVKQMSSIFAYAEEMPTIDFLYGLASFSLHPVKSAQVLNKATPALLLRRGNRNIALQDIYRGNQLSRTLGVTPWYDDFLFAMHNIGDTLSVNVGGWTLYRYVLEKTRDEKQAIAAVERVQEKTQQTTMLSQQTAWQTNSLRFLTKFRQSQNQYYNRELAAVREFKSAKTLEEKYAAARKWGLYRFVLPGMFAGFAMVVGAHFTPEDWWALAKTFLIGNTAGHYGVSMLGGEAIENEMLNIAAGKPAGEGVFEPTPSVVSQAAQLLKMGEDLQELYLKPGEDGGYFSDEEDKKKWMKTFDTVTEGVDAPTHIPIGNVFDWINLVDKGVESQDFLTLYRAALADSDYLALKDLKSRSEASGYFAESGSSTEFTGAGDVLQRLTDALIRGVAGRTPESPDAGSPFSPDGDATPLNELPDPFSEENRQETLREIREKLDAEFPIPDSQGDATIDDVPPPEDLGVTDQ